MAADLLALLKAPITALAKRLLTLVGNKRAQYQAGKKAIQGEDLADQGSLPHLVATKLKELAASKHLPPELRSDAVRDWLWRGENIALFTDALIAHSSGNASVAAPAEARLAADYARASGESEKLATGRIKTAVSYVYGQLTSTGASRHAYQLALTQAIAVQVTNHTPVQQQPFPSDADLTRVQAMAAILLEAGKQSWKMPRFIAPLTLEMHEKHEGQAPHHTGISDLAHAIDAGRNIVLFGSGGIGKTTLLLDLCASGIDAGRRIPVFVDAPVWARMNVDLFDYLAERPGAKDNHVTSAELISFAKAGHLVILLNGWNEMQAMAKLDCRERIIQLLATAPAINMVVVSRTVGDAPQLPEANHIEVRGLTWHGQSAVVRAELGEDGAKPLLELLAKDTPLRHAARSPLILRGLIARAKKGTVAQANVYDLLGAAVDAFEHDAQRHLILDTTPIDGHQRLYLEELACQLTQRQTTTCSQDDAMRAFHAAATRLVERTQIGSLPTLRTVLDVLASHHLLHVSDGMVRFTHQRFQEYFAANRLLREAVEHNDEPLFLRSVMNLPAWDDSLVLVSGKLNGDAGQATARVRLISTAAALDLGLACDLAGICGFAPADDTHLHDHLVTEVNRLAGSPLEEVRELALAYQIASGLPAFAHQLWPLVESADQQIRLQTYRLNGTRIALAQLGADAMHRIAAWPTERRAELVHELADNPDNYDFVANLALSEPVPMVRAAAIQALFWYFPASDVAMQAWLAAPPEVQTEPGLLHHIQDAFEEGYGDVAVRERLLAIAQGKASDAVKLQLALAFPDDVAPFALETILFRLRSGKHYESDAPLVAIARHHAPERLLALARELALSGRHVPDWVGKFLSEAPSAIQADIFEQAWDAFQGPDFDNINTEVLGPLANPEQTARSVDLILEYANASRRPNAKIDYDRRRQLEYLLAHARPSDVLDEVLQRAKDATYGDAAVLLDLILRRIGREDGRSRSKSSWLPSVDQVHQLVNACRDKEEHAEVPQNRVLVYLCCIASDVAPAEFDALLLEACRRQLDAWHLFHDKVAAWSKQPGLPRPSNPQLDSYLSSAVQKRGPDVLPGLLDLIEHPAALEFLPEAISRAANQPWASQREALFTTVSTDISEGANCLTHPPRQVDATHQRWTDAAAQSLGQKLYALVDNCQKQASGQEKWNAREAAYRIGQLAGAVASLPSGEVVAPVFHALASGLMDVFGVVRTIRILVRHGVPLSDKDVVAQLEAVFAQTANAKWHDDSTRHVLAELSELLLCAVPASLLQQAPSHYLQQWRSFSHINEIVRHLGATKSDAAWSMLIALGKELVATERPPTELLVALAACMDPQHFDDIVALVANGTLLAWCHHEFDVERLAPAIAAVMRDEESDLAALLDACRHAHSPLADALAGKVLAHIKGSKQACRSYLLDALDAGRAVHSRTPAFRIICNMFRLEVPINDSQFEISPQADNVLRAQLYARAAHVGPVAEGCRRLLAWLECNRREDGRPANEFRHPAADDGAAWTNIFRTLPSD